MIIELVNLLPKTYSTTTMKCHWTSIKNIFIYFHGTIDHGFSQDNTIVGYTDGG